MAVFGMVVMTALVFWAALRAARFSIDCWLDGRVMVMPTVGLVVKPMNGGIGCGGTRKIGGGVGIGIAIRIIMGPPDATELDTPMKARPIRATRLLCVDMVPFSSWSERKGLVVRTSQPNPIHRF